MAPSSSKKSQKKKQKVGASVAMVSSSSLTSNDNNDGNTNKETLYKILSNNDVLMGRGSGINNFIGNAKFRTLVEQYRSTYQTSNKHNKSKVAKELVSTIQKKPRNGCFVRLAPPPPPSAAAITTTAKSSAAKIIPGKTKCIIVSDERAIEKTAQALRELILLPSSLLGSEAAATAEEELSKSTTKSSYLKKTNTKKKHGSSSSSNNSLAMQVQNAINRNNNKKKKRQADDEDEDWVPSLLNNKKKNSKKKSSTTKSSLAASTIVKMEDLSRSDPTTTSFYNDPYRITRPIADNKDASKVQELPPPPKKKTKYIFASKNPTSTLFDINPASAHNPKNSTIKPSKAIICKVIMDGVRPRFLEAHIPSNVVFSPSHCTTLTKLKMEPTKAKSQFAMMAAFAKSSRKVHHHETTSKLLEKATKKPRPRQPILNAGLPFPLENNGDHHHNHHRGGGAATQSKQPLGRRKATTVMPLLSAPSSGPKDSNKKKCGRDDTDLQQLVLSSSSAATGSRYPRRRNRGLKKQEQPVKQEYLDMKMPPRRKQPVYEPQVLDGKDSGDDKKQASYKEQKVVQMDKNTTEIWESSAAAVAKINEAETSPSSSFFEISNDDEYTRSLEEMAASESLVMLLKSSSSGISPTITSNFATCDNGCGEMGDGNRGVAAATSPKAGHITATQHPQETPQGNAATDLLCGSFMPQPSPLLVRHFQSSADNDTRLPYSYSSPPLMDGPSLTKTMETMIGGNTAAIGGGTISSADMSPGSSGDGYHNNTSSTMKLLQAACINTPSRSERRKGFTIIPPSCDATMMMRTPQQDRQPTLVIPPSATAVTATGSSIRDRERNNEEQQRSSLLVTPASTAGRPYHDGLCSAVSTRRIPIARAGGIKTSPTVDMVEMPPPPLEAGEIFGNISKCRLPVTQSNGGNTILDSYNRGGGERKLLPPTQTPPTELVQSTRHNQQTRSHFTTKGTHAMEVMAKPRQPTERASNKNEGRSTTFCQHDSRPWNDDCTLGLSLETLKGIATDYGDGDLSSLPTFVGKVKSPGTVNSRSDPSSSPSDSQQIPDQHQPLQKRTWKKSLRKDGNSATTKKAPGKLKLMKVEGMSPARQQSHKSPMKHCNNSVDESFDVSCISCHARGEGICSCVVHLPNHSPYQKRPKNDPEAGGGSNCDSKKSSTMTSSSPSWVGRDVVIHNAVATSPIMSAAAATPSRIVPPRRVSDVGDHYMETGAIGCKSSLFQNGDEDDMPTGNAAMPNTTTTTAEPRPTEASGQPTEEMNQEQYVPSVSESLGL